MSEADKLVQRPENAPADPEEWQDIRSKVFRLAKLAVVYGTIAITIALVDFAIFAFATGLSFLALAVVGIMVMITILLVDLHLGKNLFVKKTPAQRLVFCFIFGVSLPAICFLLDPYLFKGGMYPPMGRLRFLGWTFFGLEMVIMTAWLTLPGMLRNPNVQAMISGALILGALAGLPVAAICFPFVVFLIGILPTITCWIYFREGLQAGQSAQKSISARKYRIFALIGMLAFLPLVIGWNIQQQISRQKANEIGRLAGDDRWAALKRFKANPFLDRYALIDVYLKPRVVRTDLSGAEEYMEKLDAESERLYAYRAAIVD